MYSLVLLLGGLSSVAQGAALASIDDCLRQAGVPADIPGSEDWERDAAAYNVRVPILPAAIAVPTTIPQIQKAVNCGRQSNLKVSAKAGGHSYTAGGFGGEDGHLVVELDRMYNVTLDSATNIATVQPGTRLGHMATQTGHFSRVGASGHFTHGGYGFSSHTHGLAMDWVVGATVVLANGSIVETSKTENEDLFWAIRGAGPSFGIVASWRLQTFEPPSILTWFKVALNWNRSNAANYLSAVDRYIHTDMTRELNFRIADYENGHPVAEGLFYGGKEQMESHLAPLLSASNGVLNDSREVDWLDAIRHYSADNTYNETINATVDWVVPGPPDNFYAKSLTLDRLNGTAAEQITDYWFRNATQVKRQWFIQIDASGGPTSKVSATRNNETAYAHREKTWIIQFYDAVAANETYPAGGLAFLDGWVAAVTGALEAAGDRSYGAYGNYPDPSLDRRTAQSLYYGVNLEKLRRLKARYDPGELFYSPQSIEPWRDEP
ncbi:glucooligosaccharide oxidase [Apiospora kogelbergensis]|uniref:glucooligosaccharide oxidase n=1 Tax=Apiospora kogelbergensis TaxID=1337665 RepID=UPI00312E0EB6